MKANYAPEAAAVVGVSTFLIPLTNIPQVFDIELGGVNYLLTCKWNDAIEGGWVLDLSDALTNVPLIANIPLIVGADLLAGLEYLGIPGGLYVYTDGDQFSPPTFTNLGAESNLYFMTTVPGGAVNLGNNAQYDRQCTLLVVTPGGDVLDLSQMRIKFSVKHSESMTPNTADIRVYNLAEETAVTIRKEFTKVVLQAGYPGNIGAIFKGNIKQVIIGRESATDTFVDLNCGDGDRAYNFAVVSTTLAAGSTPLDQIQAASLPMRGKGVSLGSTGTLPATQLPRGKVMFGNAREYLRKVGQDTMQSWSIQNEVINFLPVQSYAPGSAVVLTSDTGMIGTPQQTNIGVSVKCLLNPLIRPGGRIQIDNKSVQRLKINLSDPNDPVLLAPPLSTDGMYYVLITDFSGDTRGVDWYTTVIGILIDQTTAAIGTVGTNYSG